MGRRQLGEADRVRVEGLVAELSAARERKGVSVYDLAIASGVHYETVRAVLSGRSVGPSFFTVADLARTLKVSLARIDQLSRP